ncbi:hypothetical protein BVG19_g3686 [[Candida] boidinii]|nr:hypothetical protein BVG19_g3686 [[Candida] boidinii]OWB52490.1 hypothetical protein B5S27_g4066 [[Candida] boidinii]OWB86805.1 hypothetical protein B5S33_g5519 [[Candida] boidinii]
MYNITSTSLTASQRSNLTKILNKLYPKQINYFDDLIQDINILIINTNSEDNLNSDEIIGKFEYEKLSPPVYPQSKKFQYVIKYRPEILIISYNSILIEYNSWINGESIKPLNELPILKIFENLLISISRLNENLTMILRDLVESHGGKLSTSLNSNTFALITNLQKGKRYEMSIKWEIPVVSPDWVIDSVEREGLLFFNYYRLVRENGKGFKDDACDWSALREFKKKRSEDQKVANALKKRKLSDPEDEEEAANDERDDENKEQERSMRVSKKILNQNENVWTSIMNNIKTTNDNTDKNDDDDLNQDKFKVEKFFPVDQEENSNSNKFEIDANDNNNNNSNELFQGLKFKFFKFDSKQSKILSKVIKSHKGEICEEDSDSDSDSDSVITIINSSKVTKDDLENITRDVITEFGIERCLYYNKLLFDNKWSKPLLFKYDNINEIRNHLGLIENNEIINICITEFKGIELTHLIKLISTNSKLVKYNEILNKKRDLLIVNFNSNNYNSNKINEIYNNEKIKFCQIWKIKCISIETFFNLII